MQVRVNVELGTETQHIRNEFTGEIEIRCSVRIPGALADYLGEKNLIAIEAALSLYLNDGIENVMQEIVAPVTQQAE